MDAFVYEYSTRTEKAPFTVEFLVPEGPQGENCQKFHLDNVEAICGLAPECLEGLPVPDVAFIGGSSGNMEEIVKYLYGLNSHMRFVATPTPTSLSEI